MALPSTAPMNKLLSPQSSYSRRVSSSRATFRPVVQSSSTFNHSNNGSVKPAPSRQSLKDPAHIGAASFTTLPVKELPPFLLDTYMRLPVAQYYELDPNMVKPLGNSRFLLCVPRIQLFNVWLEPVVEVVVKQLEGPSRVVIEAVSCKLNGSQLIEQFQLNRRFYLSFVNELTWVSEGGSSYESTNGGPASRNGNGASKTDESAVINSDLKLDVWCEIIPPFNLLPREVLQGTGNTVMKGLVNTLLPVFVKRLASDYERWAVDEVYRKRREAQVVQKSAS